MAEPSSL